MATQRARPTKATSRWVVSLLLMILLSGCVLDPNGDRRVPLSPDPVQMQLEAMSLNERVGQLLVIGLEGKQADDQALEMLRAKHVGGFILYQDNIETAAQTIALLNSLKEANASNRAPAWFSVDQEGGKVSRMPADYAGLPSSGVIGQSNSPDYAFEIGAVLGMALKSLGFNMNFAPVLDIDSNPNNPVIGDRSFGAGPDLVSALGVAALNGMQAQSIVSVVKHFPGHGDTAVDSHVELPVVNKSLESLRTFELQPFERAIQQGADAIMVAHILLPELDEKHPASLSKAIITDLLRQQLSFDGVVITDDMTMGALTNYPDIGGAAVQAVKAGVDILLVAHDYPKALAVLNALNEAVASGALSQERIDQSVYRILALKQKYQLSDQPTVAPDVQAVNARIEHVLAKYAP